MGGAVMLPKRMGQILERIRGGETTVTDAADVELLLTALGYILEAYMSDGNIWRAIAHARQIWRIAGGYDGEEVGIE